MDLKMYEHFFVVANIAERLGISYCDTGGSPAFLSVVRMTKIVRGGNYYFRSLALEGVIVVNIVQ